MGFLNKAAGITPPVVGANVFVVAGTASSAGHILPTELIGVEKGFFRSNWITVQADGDSFYLAFGTSSETLDETGVTTMAASPTLDGGECIKITDGATMHFCLDEIAGQKSDITHIHIKGTGTAGYLRMWRSSGKVTRA